MNSRRTISLLVLLVSVAAGCSQWKFQLQESQDWPIEGRKLVNKDSVNVLADNLLSVAHPARAAFRSKPLTDGGFSTEVRLVRGSGFALVFRSTPFDDSTAGGPNALRLHVAGDLAQVQTRDTVFSHQVNCPTGKPFRIDIVQHGEWVDLEVACIKVPRFLLRTPSTQWVTVIPDSSSRVELRDPAFRSIEDVFKSKESL
jgi:hypothetical protein